jgi:hypothetical protein
VQEAGDEDIGAVKEDELQHRGPDPDVSDTGGADAELLGLLVRDGRTA